MWYVGWGGGAPMIDDAGTENEVDRDLSDKYYLGDLECTYYTQNHMYNYLPPQFSYSSKIGGPL